jgi:DNA primase
LVGRKYHDIGKSLRYYNLSSKDIEKYHFSKPSESFSFLDEVVSNPKTNVLYITEGYFDAYSVNKSMNDYVAISLLGKNLSKNGLEILKHNFTPLTKIKIVLDSIEKDKGNVESILNLSKRLQSYYPDTEIVVLKHSDPNDIFTSMGPDHLRIIMKNQSTRIHDFAIQNQIRIPKGTASNVNLRKFITDWK